MTSWVPLLTVIWTYVEVAKVVVVVWILGVSARWWTRLGWLKDTVKIVKADTAKAANETWDRSDDDYVVQGITIRASWLVNQICESDSQASFLLKPHRY